MFNKKYLMLSIFLLSLLTLSVVSASDNATEVISLEESNDAISIEESQTIGQSGDDTLMEPDGGTFTDLQRKIDNANASSTITLENNYTYDDGFNKEGVLISKEITIEGNGFTIDGKEVSRIFNVTSTGVVFKNIIFANGHAEGNGGAISGSATAIGCTFNKNYANGDGGALYNVNAESCTFSGNCAEYRGGGIYNGNATRCTFTDNNYAKQAGGGMYTGDALNCIFTGNGAADQGAAMYGGNAVGCTFENNQADNHGAAISNGNAVNCTFTGNHVNHNGGAIYMGSATDCNFTENYAWLGGALYSNKEEHPIVNCNFNGNWAYLGGAVYGDGIQYSVKDSYFKENGALRGGGIYNGTATNCMFVNNAAREANNDDDGDGGAMYAGAAYYCTFDTNYAHDDGDGGALSHSYAENCIFIKNHAADCGGAIYYTDAVNCNFTENSASGEGGAIYKGDATNCTFENNILDGNGEDGGAIRYGNAYNCNFTGNKAYHGGAMHSGYAENCIFDSNSADGGGAGRYLDAKNCIFKHCYSSTDGGAIHVGDVENCTFFDNKAKRNGGAIYYGNAKNCTFNSNIAKEGGAMHYGDMDSDKCTAEYCTFIFNEAELTGEGGGGATCGIDVYHSTFSSNHAEGYGGAMYEGYAYNCTFNTNTAEKSGDLLYKVTRKLCKMKGWGDAEDEEDTTVIVEDLKVEFEEKSEYAAEDSFKIRIVDDDGEYPNFETYVHVTGPNNYNETFIVLSGSEWSIPMTKSGQYQIEFGVVDMLEINVVSMNIMISSPVHLTTNDISTTYGEDEYYVITLTDVLNRPIYNATVNVDFIDAKDYTTDENGQINISIKDLKPGTYTAKASFDNISYDKVININTIFIDKQTVMLIPNTMVTTYNSNDVLIISLYDNKNNPIKNITLSADLNGTKNYTTDKQGQIKISPKGLIPDTYLIDIVFEGNDIYHNSKATGKVIIQKDFTKLIASTMIATYNDGKELTITLTDGFDNPISEASIVVDLDGSKKYTTDKNGQIKISHEDLIPDSYEVNITFKGNDLYKESKIVTTIVINKIGTNINADSLTKEFIFAKDYVIIINDDNGNPAGNVSVVLDLNGTKEFTTDENGQIKFNIYDDKIMMISINDNEGNPLKNVKLSVNLNGTEKYTTDSKGQIKVSTAGFAPGTYPVEVAFGGNEIYSKSNASAKLTVVKCTTQLTANSLSTEYGEHNDLIVILKDNLGNPINDVQISVDLDGIKNYTTDNNGQINVSTSKLAPGTYIAKIHFEEDNYCFGCDMQTIVEVKKTATQIIISPIETTYNSGVFSLIYLKDIDGHPITNASLSIDLNGVKNYTTEEYGEVILSTYGLTPGNHTVMIKFSENDYYAGSSKEIYINIEESETTLIADAVETDYGLDKYLFITLKDGDNYPMTYAKVSVDLNGVKNYTTNGEGNIRVPLQNMTPGNYVAKISFDAKYYIASSIETSVVINKIESKLSANSVATTYGFNEDLVINLTDSDGKPIANATVSVELDSVKKYTTDEKGQIIISSNSITPGSYIAKISIDDRFHKCSAIETAVVVNKIASKLSVGDVSTTYNVNKDLIISLKDINGKPISKASVSVDLGGVKNYVTDANGQIKVPIQKLAPNTYVAKISLNGNSHYKDSKDASIVVVKKASPKITAKSKKFKAKAKSKKYTITLKNNKKQAMKKVKVYLKVKGKTYAAKTNSKGKATFKITKLTKKGKYKATITYKGNKYYNRATKKVKITVK